MFCFEWTDEHPSRCQFSDLLLKRLVLIDLSLIEEPTSAGTELASGIRQSERGSYAPSAGFDSAADAQAFAEAAWIIAPIRYAPRNISDSENPRAAASELASLTRLRQASQGQSPPSNYPVPARANGSEILADNRRTQA